MSKEKKWRSEDFNIAGRLSYPHIFTPGLNPKSKKPNEFYSTQLLIEKGSKSDKIMKEKIELAKEDNPDLKGDKARFYSYKDGDLENEKLSLKGKSTKPEYENHMIFYGKSYDVIKVKDRDGSDIREGDSTYYPGATYVVNVSLWKNELSTDDDQGMPYIQHQLNGNIHGMVFLKATDKLSGGSVSDDKLMKAVGEFDDLAEILS